MWTLYIVAAALVPVVGLLGLALLLWYVWPPDLR